MSPPPHPTEGPVPWVYHVGDSREVARGGLEPSPCTNCYWVKLKPAVTTGPRKITFEPGPQYFLRVWISAFRPFTLSKYMTTNIEKSEVWCQ